MRHLQLFAEQAAAERRQEAEQRARLQHAGARHVGDDDAALRSTSTRPGTPRCEEALSSSGSSEVGIDAAQEHVEPLQAGDGADVDAAVADGEVVALDQQEAEIARQRRRARNRSR